MQFFPLPIFWSNDWVRNHIVKITEEFSCFFNCWICFIGQYTFPMSFKTLSLYAFFHYLTKYFANTHTHYTMSVLIAGHSQTKYLHKYLPPGYKVSPHSGAHIQLWWKICSTITNFACVVCHRCQQLAIRSNNYHT